MINSRVWIHYRPRLYQDLFKQLFRSFEQVEVVDVLNTRDLPGDEVSESMSIANIVILHLDEDGNPVMDPYIRPLVDAKYVAFPLSGDYGLRRLPGATHWEEIRPFGVHQLLSEVLCES